MYEERGLRQKRAWNVNLNPTSAINALFSGISNLIGTPTLKNLQSVVQTVHVQVTDLAAFTAILFKGQESLIVQSTKLKMAFEKGIADVKAANEKGINDVKAAIAVFATLDEVDEVVSMMIGAARHCDGKGTVSTV